MNSDPYRSYRFTSNAALPGVAAAFLFARNVLAPALSGAAGRPVVELGAGSGTTLLALRRLGFKLVQGCDGSPAQVEIAKKLGTEVELADGLRFLEQQPASSLGAVIALDVLEHLEDDELAAWLAAAQERLVPGGVFLARVPNGEGLFGGTILHGDLTHRRAFTTESLRQSLGPAGFRKLEFLPCRPLIHGPPSLLRWLAWLVVETAVRAASFSESGRWGAGVFTRNLVVIARNNE